MIAEFTIENFRSFKEKHTFSLLATSQKELLDQNTFAVKKARFLKSAVLYGANASGKSNFFTAFAFFRNFAVFSGPRKQIGDSIEVDSFNFSKQTENQPSSFEIIFFVQNAEEQTIRYRYGFSVTQEKVMEEYLFAINNVKEILLFSRDESKIIITDYFREGLRSRDLVRPNCSLLSICAQNNGEIAKRIIIYFQTILITSGLQNTLNITQQYLRNKFDKANVLDFLHFADIQVNDLDVKHEPVDIATLPQPLNAFLKSIPQGQPLQSETFYFGHTRFDNTTDVGTVFLPANYESSGTQKLFSYSIPILEALKNGAPIFIDEFDTQLHPLILESIVKLFNSPVTNPKNAQLVISCHAVNILTNKIFRRDQIWFCEKDEYGATDLYSLVEYEEPVRNDASYNKDYLRGKYGAVPYIDVINLQLGKTDYGT
jgi:AAA15 family ATPase/GTPase